MDSHPALIYLPSALKLHTYHLIEFLIIDFYEKVLAAARDRVLTQPFAPSSRRVNTIISHLLFSLTSYPRTLIGFSRRLCFIPLVHKGNRRTL
jgi:hypothetical protein